MADHFFLDVNLILASKLQQKPIYCFNSAHTKVLIDLLSNARNFY